MLVERISRTNNSTDPARRLFRLIGGAVTGALTWSHSWIYVLASLLGGASAAALFAYLHPSLPEADRLLVSQVERPAPDSRSGGGMQRKMS